MESLETESSLLLEDFGQKVDLTRRIREVLINYPEGTTVLKELIQNADDAGATKVCLCLDRRVHRVESLLSGKLAEWQGPALLAFNNAEFTEEDFVSISRIGDSKKQKQAWKTGRFGVGFNSVYHLTDLPSFVSGKYVVLFDPQGVYLPNVSAANPGKRIEYVTSSAISLYKDQFSPYCAFGCDMKKPFPGTLFRFPLRNADQAASSKLSRQAYTEDDISSMFVQLYEEGVFTLLFLKSVLSVEMYIWDDGSPDPQKLYSCSVSSQHDDTVWHRQALLRLSSNSFVSPKNEMDSFSLDFLSEASVGSNMEKRINTFFIVQAMASTSSRIGAFATAAAKEYDVQLLPWASVAACISDSSSEADVLNHGRAFCFLPLPIRTGLAVQVNGYFEVSSNRRSIWYGDDMDRGGKLRSDWNRLLLEDVVVPAYKSLLLGARSLIGSTKFYSLWPCGSFEEPWKLLVEQIYKSISNSPVLFSDLEGGKWVSPTEAYLHDEEFIKSKELGEALLLLGMPIVHLPKPLINMLLKYSSSFQLRVVTPATVRSYIRNCRTLVASSRFYKLVLLEYCLDDLLDEDVVTHANALPLLPLTSGDFGSFSAASQGISYFICSDLEYKLLDKVTDRLIDRNIPPDIMSRLSAIAQSSNSNICFFNVKCLVQLFPRIFPVDWQYKNIVLWDPESYPDHPPASWFVTFWLYLRDQNYNLSIFGDWPILPSTSRHLYRASKQSKLIDAGKLSNTMTDLLVKIDCRILNPDYEIQHKDLPQYVYDADGAGVLAAIFDVLPLDEELMQTSFYNFGEDERNELRQFLLDPRWYVGDGIADSQIQKCKWLPIYKVYGGGASSNNQFSNLKNPQKYLPPLNIPEYLLGGEFIQSTTDIEEDILLRYYKVVRMEKTFFYKNQVLYRLGELLPDVRDSVMLSILRELPQLCAKDASFREVMRKLEFVPTSTGVLKCPQVLYDPRNEELYSLLEDSDSFPCGVFEESNILDMLQGLGLRTSVSPETIIESARQVELLRHSDQGKANTRGKVLLAYLEVNAGKWLLNPSNNGQRMKQRTLSRAATVVKSRNLENDLDKFWNDMKMICWCPVLVSAPHQTLPWPSASSVVAPPKLVRLRTDLWLVSASMRILDGECSSTALSCSLGWSSPPGGSIIAAQLLELGKNNELVTDQVLRQELALAMPRIYSILTGMMGSDEMDIVKAILEGCRWIWVGDGFAISDEVVLNGPLHLAPYIRVIPIDLAVFRELFLELGIREFLKRTDYASILCRMATQKGSTPLDPEELRAALLIVQHLADVHFQHQQVQVYLPDSSSRLFAATSLVYNDAPWLLGSESPESAYGNASTTLLSTRDVHKFVHGNISNDVAEKLGVCSLRRLLLAESADSMNLSLSGAAEAFGQHEALTTRLKHIVEMYADGPGILFELVQNAEDAGASEVTFLLDKTQYGTSSVLSPEMADWQGPALYCFNTSVFSAQDLYAISRIGQDSKLEKPFAIGRFGLGFNCVYHFTDIPAFVSGENIVMFDPHACHLPGISPSHPGLRIKFAGRRILEQFPDQFSPFLHFGCDLQHPFPGTLFRFPLRNDASASRSLIKKEKYAPDDVLALFSTFSEVVSEALLFLRKVKIISIFVKDGVGHDMKLIHRVEREHISGLEISSHPHNNLLGFIHGNHSGIDRNQFLNKLNKTIETELPWNCQKVVVTERDISGEKSHIWMMSECLGGGRAKKKAIHLDNKSHNFIPWGCVAAYLHTVNLNGTKELNGDQSAEAEDGSNSSDSQVLQESGQYRRNFDGRAFCFLPLPISTGLPTHVNAYFELSSNRRDIWFGNDMAGGGKVRSDWNLYLLEDVVAPAYGRLLEKVASEIGPCDLFSSFWPVTNMVEPWASMVRKLYKSASDLGLRVLYTEARGGQWISTKQAIFPDFHFSKAEELVEALSDAGLPLVRVSKAVVERFAEACPSLHFLTPQLLRALLIRRKRGFRDRNAMILTLEYCLSDVNVTVQSDSLYGLPLVPLANGLFTIFSKRGDGERIFITSENEYGLLKDLVPHLLIDSSIPEGVQSKLCDIAQGDSNISLLTCKLLEELFPRLMPGEWQNSKQVMWTPGQQGQPSLEWLGLLWSYLRSSCDDLSMFSKWPILPVGKNCLLQLVRNSNVVKDEGWSENMLSLLQKVGCFFLRLDLPINHPQLSNYVQDSTATGILNALLVLSRESHDIDSLFIDASEGELHELRSFILQSKWFSGGQMDSKHINVIKQLPMFESYRSRRLVSLSKPTKWIKPEGVHEELLNEAFVRTESEKDKTILKSHLEIKELSRAEFYKDFVLNRMSEFLSQPGSLSAILRDVKLLIEEDISIKTVLSQTPFVLAANGSWQLPSKLYDPRVPELQEMLHEEAFFPSEKFLDTETLDTLIDLGLNRTLGLHGLLDSATSVSMLYDSGDQKALNNGRRLLSCLDALGFKLSKGEREDNCGEVSDADAPCSHISSELRDGVPGSEYLSATCKENSSGQDLEFQSFLGDIIHNIPDEEFWTKIKIIAWCPVYVDPPLQVLPWFTSKHQVAAPIDVRPKSQMWMMSSTMRILDGECCSKYLQSKLGWLDYPNVGALSTQLVGLSKSYSQLKLQGVEDTELDSILQKEIPTLYSKMNEFVGTDDLSVLKSSLNGISWVWIGDNFISPEALAFDSPVKFHPYLYAVPSELSEYRNLLLALGVKLTFDALDYVNVLNRLKHDLKGLPLSAEQLSFVLCILEAIAECYADKPLSETSNGPLLMPDSSGVLMNAVDLVYNDAPWMEQSTLASKHFVHPSISNDLSDRLGVQSLRCLSLVDEEMIKNLPCMDYARISGLLSLYGNNDFLLFDLLELADCCKAKKLHLIFDKREHSRQSLLQHNLGEYQGPALVAVLDGATLSQEEVSSLQLLPPWRLRGNTLNYGLGLLSCYFICDLPAVVSNGYFYMFDPLGKALAPPSSNSPSAKMFSLKGARLTERFRDQFSPMLIGQNMPWSSSDSTVIRMPLSSSCMKDGLQYGSERIMQIFDRFMEHASSTLLFLKSVFQVSLSTWEEGDLHPSQNFSVCIDPSLAIMRNPFSEKKWRKFQISRLFSSSNTTIKIHTIDVHMFERENKVVDKWIVVLSLGSGQTRNMALDRRYMAYDLTPVAGVAAHISRNGQPADAHSSSCILSPLPLSKDLRIPVTMLGCFLVRPNCGRSLFKCRTDTTSPEPQLDAGNQLIEAWNRELMCCVRDSYVEMVLEMQRLRREPSNATIDSSTVRVVSPLLQAYGDRIYLFWPRSKPSSSLSNQSDAISSNASSSNVGETDWECLIKQVIQPFYSRLVDLPVWQLYSGRVVKAEDGMFLAQPGNEVGDNLTPSTVFSFIKEHYPVFSVPWELVSEIQAVGVAVREIRPKMVRNLLKASSTSIALRSVNTYIDVLEYCLSDIELKVSNSSENDSSMEHDIHNSSSRTVFQEGNSSTSISHLSMQASRRIPTPSLDNHGGDPLEIMTSFGKALFDFGRGVVEDIGRAGGPLVPNSTITGSGSGSNFDPRFASISAELKGLLCPTATSNLARLGVDEIWVGSKEQQTLMGPLAAKFIHPECLGRSIIADIFSDQNIQMFLKLQSFSHRLLANNMRLLFSGHWVNHVMSSNKVPWFSWESNTHSSAEGGPSPEWIRLFWKSFNGSPGDISLFSDWPLIPAFLGRSVLCRVREHHLVFIPPLTDPTLGNDTSELSSEGNEATGSVGIYKTRLVQSYILAFEVMNSRFPWLSSFLNQCNIPIYDTSFLEGASSCNCIPTPGHSLGKVIVTKLFAAKRAGYFVEPAFSVAADRDQLFNLFASDLSSPSGPTYTREEIELLRGLPIYKTVLGSYTRLHDIDQCIISPRAFFQPCDERCLSYSTDATRSLFHSLGVPELHDEDILVRFALPGFEGKSQEEQEDILIYLYTNWRDLEADANVVSALKETKFVRNASALREELFKPKDLLDPSDSLLKTVFTEDRNRFPGERFTADGWLLILRKAGLRTSTEADVILECARKVEFLGEKYMSSLEGPDSFDAIFSNSSDGISVEIWSLAVSVVQTIFLNFAVLYNNNFCDLLSKIAFIPAERGLPYIGGKKGGKRVLCSYNEAILLNDWPLSWSSAPILTNQSVVPPDYAWKALHLRSPPAFSTVLKHLEVIGRNGGEDTLAHWPAVSGMMTVEEASREILLYLDKIWSNLSASDVSKLKEVAFVPVANGTRLVTANSLFVRLTTNLAPFVFELPTLYLPFMKVLKDLGLQDALSLTCAKDLLLNIQKACGYQRLNPNELRAVMEILQFICDAIAPENIEDKSSYISEAIVPDDGCRLVVAGSCVYIDSFGSRFIRNIDISRIRFVHPDLPERICTALGIRKLSDVAVEELDQGQELQSLDNIGSLPLARIKEKLSSRSFQSAVWRIVNSTTGSFPTSECPDLEQIQRSLESVAEKLQFVRILYTRFILLPKSVDITRVNKESVIPQWEDGLRHRSFHFVDRSKTYALVAEPPYFISVSDVIAIVVSQVLGSTTPLPLGPLFSAPASSEQAIVDALKLGSDRRKNDLGVGSNQLVGKDLMPQDARQVQFHPLRPFYSDEIVAWRTGKDGDKLKYGKVPEDVRPSAGQSLYRFKVETAPGDTQLLLSSQVLSFKSISVVEEASSSTLSNDGNVERENRNHVMVQGAGIGGTNTSQAAKEHSYGRVSAAELVQAVNEMLSAAGISMNTEKQSVLQTALTLQEQLKESQTALLLEQEKADSAAKEAETAKAAWMCRVCLNSEVDASIVPCGHVLCRGCASHVSRCPFCRLQVSKTMKIFRP